MHFMQGKCNPPTVRDMHGDRCHGRETRRVCLCFHPHGWINNTQIVELIDHAEISWRQSQVSEFPRRGRRLTQNLLGGHPLRNATGGDNGVRWWTWTTTLLDVVVANDQAR